MQKLQSQVNSCRHYQRRHASPARSGSTPRRLLGMVCLGWALVTAAGGVQAAPVSVTQNVAFQVNNESFWGGGTGYKFGSAGQFGPSAVNFAWDIGASTGTVDASVAGGMTTSFNNLRYGPGSVPFHLGFSGQANGGALSSDLGA